MLGAIIGDIAGSRFEFNRTNDYNFELFTDECGFTDDTICTCAIADALLKGNDYGEALHEWCRKYPHPMGGYGGRFAQWVRSEDPQPYGSFGNGSAMRVSPVAWFHHKREWMLEEAKKTAECTHGHPEGIKGAQTVALAISEADRCRRYKAQPNDIIKDVIEECVKFSGYNINIRKEDVINKFDETCQGTVPVALWIINQSNSFENAIRRAVSLGADADTLGAIVGSIAEAIWGIPEEIEISALSFLDDRMKDLLGRWREHEKTKAIDIETFIDKYIDHFTRSDAYDNEFDRWAFIDECWSLGFVMDFGHSFAKAYSTDAWRTNAGLLKIVNEMNDIKVMGNALFSCWTYFHYWTHGFADSKNKEWALAILRRMKELI